MTSEFYKFYFEERSPFAPNRSFIYIQQVFWSEEQKDRAKDNHSHSKIRMNSRKEASREW